MWEAIRSNRRRSMGLVILMGILLVTLGFAIGLAIDPSVGGGMGSLIALGLWFFLYLVALLSGDRILLSSSHAHKIQKENAPMLWNVVEEMTIASGLGKMPDVYIIDDPVPNAFAVGRKPEKAAVAVTSGLLKRLNRDELQGVVAHEIGHIKNLDVKFMTLASVMLGTIVIISDLFVRSMFYGGGRRRGSRDNDQGQVVLFLIALVLAIVAPLLAQILYFACSRKREYLADASAARFTRFPEGLASALEKIASNTEKMQYTNRALTPLYIVNPLAGRSLTGLFSTHPPTEKRVQVLRNMTSAGYGAYEQAYRTVLGSRRACLGSQTLAEAEDVGKRGSLGTDSKEDAIQRIAQVNDLLGAQSGFLPLLCSCGLRLKIPAGFAQTQLQCPKCGTTHALPPQPPAA